MKINKPRKFILRPEATQHRNLNNRRNIHFPPHLHINQFEPMRQNRWMIEFDEELNIEPFLAKSVTRPTYNFENNNGFGSWEEMVIEFYDTIGTNISQTLMEFINDINNNRAFKFRVAMLDPTGVVIDSWAIDGHLRSVDWSNLDYNYDGVCTITVSVTPHAVILQH